MFVCRDTLATSTLARKWLKGNVSCCSAVAMGSSNLALKYEPMSQQILTNHHLFRTCKRDHIFPPWSWSQRKMAALWIWSKGKSDANSLFFFDFLQVFSIRVNTHHRVVSVFIPSLLAPGFIQSSSTELFWEKRNTILEPKDALNEFLQHHIV